ncbi:MAG TPA: amino acid adenylation domain-containing protein, partial [Thermoanaerobaculia bacterium]|nr:amino acid adenylation domain-containing protein [Thermoanaerobaculia bacterium]
LPGSGEPAAPERRADPGFLAYLIYTSGSTGRPKGVAIEHRSAVALARWARELFPADELDGVLASTSVCFDISVFELLVPLAWGGRVILAENALELPAIAAAGADVRLINTVPSAMAELMRQGALPTSVRTVNLAGEPLPGVLAERIYQRDTVRRVLNLYGPSEDTTYSTFALVARGSGEPTIGRPITGSRIYVLDAAGCPVLAGVPGELFLGGEGLARGYLGRPDLTAMSFVPDPFGGERGQPGARLYRTGDLVRFQPDGSLQFLGRIDHQVKVRGFRIEPGEIEVALGRHPGVREAAVVVHENQPGDKRLVAWVAPEGAPAPSPSELRETLRQRLPEYMLPSAFVFLEALPLSPNGKVDRRALARMAPALDEGTPAADTPRDTTEELLAGIWAEVLGREQVGPYDSFFDIGGHSLLATQVASRVRNVFGVEVPLHHLFAFPTVAKLADFVRAAREIAAAAAPPIEPVPRGEGLPLSFAQQRLWFLDQLQPGLDAYNVPAAVRLRGALEPQVVEQVFREVARRHESLRTTFAAGADGPVQVIAPEPRLPLPRIDLSGLPGERREAEAHALTSSEARRPFDLAAGPLIRTALFRLSPDDHVLLVVMHHAVSDGWSAGILLRELATLYPAFSGGEGSPLPPLPVQYVDFAAWQRSWLAGETLAAEIAHWRTRLGDAPRSLELPLDRPRPMVQSFRGAVREAVLAPDLGAALSALGRREGATPFMVLLAAFQALLARYTGQEDFLVGFPVAGRNRHETEGLIGFFVNTLVLRADLAADPAFRETLVRVRETALDAFDHQDLPLERLVEELQPERDLSRNPLFQVVFALQNAPAPALEIPGLMMAVLALPARTAKFDLTLSLSETGSGFAASLEHNTDLFDGSTAARLLEHFRSLLEAVAADPEVRLSAAPLLAAGERQQLLVEWNGGCEPEEPRICVHRLVEVCAAAAPDSPAVVLGDVVLSYGELNARANRLARHLQGLGVGPEVTVGVCLRRSPEEAVALLAVLKAGGAYLPLDPVYPQERQAFLLADAGARVLLTESALAGALPASGALRIELDREEPALRQHGGGNPESPVAPANLAYVIYTSGSTGRPKGVHIEHRMLLRLIVWHRRAFAVTPGDRATRLAGPAFDASVWELWPYLVAGASIHIPDEETRTSPAALRDWLLAERITVAFVPTPMAEALLPLGWPRETSLRTLLTGGDRLHQAPVAPLPFHLVNNYGPTENTVVATSGEVPCGGPADRAPSIGRPLDSVRAILLDRWLQPVPTGVPGEICLGGGQLARGYHGRPDLTAERFVPAVEAAEAGARMYRTGDLARWLPNGEIEFLGRLDGQVKIRGFRIEPGEIEAALAAHPAVRGCAVVAREEAGGRHLVAYVTGEDVPQAHELRDFLRTTLPEHMVPAAFVPLAALPLTPNGKVDRRALPAPERTGGRATPRDPLELELARIWEELLGRPVGSDDDFFELGGHSLLAVRLMGRIQERLGRKLPLTALFQAATVERLAAVLRGGLEPAGRSILVPIREGGPRPPLFLVHPVGGNLLCYAELARLIGSEQPVWGLQSPDRAPDTLEGMARLYLEALRTVQPHSPYRLAGWSLGGVIAFEMARQIEVQGGEVGSLVLIDSFCPAGQRSDDADVLDLFSRDLEGLLGSQQALAQADPAELQRSFEMFRANLLALSRYEAGPYGGRIVLFRAAEREGDPSPGWAQRARGGVEVYDVPGTHYSLLQNPAVSVLADRLRHGDR